MNPTRDRLDELGSMSQLNEITDRNVNELDDSVADLFFCSSSTSAFSTSAFSANGNG